MTVHHQVNANARVAVLGAGFIGMNLIRRLLGSGTEVSVLDHNAPPDDLQGRVNWVRGDFSEQDAVEQALRGAACAIHLVSSTVPGDEHVEATRELSDNLFATLGFLKICEQLRVPRVVFSSSSSVYGLQRQIPIPETAVTDPISSHGIQKLTIEKYLLLHRFNSGLDVRIARLSNPFGPGQRLFGRQGFIALTIGHMLRDEPILLRDEGRPVRDFIYIDDVADAFQRLATLAESPAVINVGSGSGHSLRQIVDLLNELTARPARFVAGEARKADIPVSVLDVSLASRGIGFRPSVSLREGLETTLRHHGIAIAGAAGGR
jgi:UDP-glucose 4-epimerase